MWEYRIKCDDLTKLELWNGIWVDEAGSRVTFTVNVDEAFEEDFIRLSERFTDFVEAMQLAQEMARKYGEDRVLIMLIDSSCEWWG